MITQAYEKNPSSYLPKGLNKKIFIQTISKEPVLRSISVGGSSFVFAQNCQLSIDRSKHHW